MSPLSPPVIALICSKNPSQIICTWGSQFFPKFLLTLPHYSTETACIRYQLFAKLNPAASSPSHLLDGAACDAVDHSVPKFFFHLASKTSHFLVFLLPTWCFLRVFSPCSSFSSLIAEGCQDFLFHFCSLLQSHSMNARLSCSWLPNIFPSSDLSSEVHAALSNCLSSTTTWGSKRHHKINLPVQTSVQSWNPGSSLSSLPLLLVITSFLSELNPCNHSWPLSFSHTPPRIYQAICWLYVHN